MTLDRWAELKENDSEWHRASSAEKAAWFDFLAEVWRAAGERGPDPEICRDAMLQATRMAEDYRSGRLS